jgi:hypothetical protein
MQALVYLFMVLFTFPVHRSEGLWTEGDKDA